ncbi:hypothetical protein OC861_003216 [Tilletia horrida]|nr:hypothetical protein OC861_003216 [Tilletia horrida]
MATISTFAESTVSTLDEAAQEERAQFVQREERRKRVAKMSRWLGVVVPPELVTSPGHNQAQQTGGTFSSSSSSPNLDRPRDSIDPSPAFSSHLHGPHGVTHLSSAAGLGAALQSVSSEEVKQRMAKVAGRLIKLGSTPMGTSNSAGTSSATGTNAVRAGGRLAALDLSGASTSAGSYKQLRPPNLDLSEAQHDRLHHFGNASAPMDPNDLPTPVSRVNVLSPRERIAIVKRANKLEKVFGEAPPHGMIAVLPHNLEGPGGRRRSLHQHSNSAPITPHGFGLSGVSSQFAHSAGDMAFQAALKDLLVSVPPSSASTRHRQHHPYAASITSSPRSMRSTYATSIASLEYLLDNDVPLLNDMMTALEEEEGSDTPGHSAPGSARQSLEGSRPATALGITTKSENVATPSASKELPDRAPEPKSPDTPGSSHRRHRSLMSPTQNNSHFEISRPESSGGADAASTIDHAELKALTPAALFRRRSESATEDPSQLSPLQTAPWDLFDGSASSAYHFGLSNVGDNLNSPGTSYEAGRASHLSASPALGVAGGSGAVSPAFALSADRRASLISHLSRLSSTPSLSTLSSISPPGSPRDPISAEHDFRRQRALRAQKLGRFFGAEPSAMPSALVHGLSGGGAGAGASLMPDLFGNANSADSTSAGTNHVMARSSSVGGSALGASFTGAVATGDTTSSIGPHSNVVTPTRTIFPSNPVASVSSGIANHFQGGTDGPGPSAVRTRRLAPRSAGSAKPQTSFIRMLRSLEEEAMEDETLTPVELKAIRARLNAMRRRGEEGSARLLDGDIVI